MEDSKLMQDFADVFDIEIKSLIMAKSKIGENYQFAAELIANSNKVILSGIGKSGLIAKKIAATLSSYNLSAVFLHPVEALHGDIGIIQKNDVVIFVSKSGSTDEIVRLVPFIKSRNAKIISIITNTKSYLGANSDIVLEAAIEREACPFGIAPTSSTTVALVIGDALAIAAALLSKVTLKDFSRTHPLGTIGKTLTLQVKDIMHTNSNIPIINDKAFFKDAIIEISKKKLGCVLVINSIGKLVGIITDGDVRRTLQKFDEIKNIKVIDIMNQQPITVHEDIYLDVALSIMENRESQINVLPVVDDSNKPIGVIRLHDIILSGK
ncbi:MAG TPA: KpsF/GutQ family sugar-phosphate isomerase [Bacteroidota bacterium]|nr:KpsF/GutQ family sugar-phosphate isomerase [Candidatus Kapabacteria bacterium]HRS01410.1 KpsF/GutQ family sugar-phosphate isomerase [Bacteroidota bacterium]HRT67213.1 KpsF/GutQ family sugar-phosphate isomerase [Bacteroidota bacterium]